MKILRSPNLSPGDNGIMVQITTGRQFARGGLVQAASKVRGAGRYGDTMLVHINPEEFAQLKRAWGEPHYNPDTKLPEFFDWFSAIKTVAPYVLGAFGKKASIDQANQNPAPPADPNMTTHLGAPGTNARTAAFTNHEDPSSYYTYGQKSGERQYFKNNSLGAVKYTPGAQVQPKLQSSPSTGQTLLGGLAGGALQYAMQNPEKVWSGVKGLFGGSSAAAPAAANTTTYGGLGALGGTPSGIGAGGSLVGTGGAAAGADAAAAGGSGLLPGSIAGANMADTAAYTPSMIEATSPGAGAGSGLGATLGGVGAAVGLGVLGKHLQDNTAGMGYQQSRDLVNWYNDPHSNFTDPTHGRGADANTPLAPPPPGFPSWTKYFMAQQIIGQAASAQGGAKDQGTYNMILGELGLPTDRSFYSKAWPGAELAFKTIIGPNGYGTGSNSRGGRARGGLIQRFDVGGLAQTNYGQQQAAFQPQQFGALGNIASARGMSPPAGAFGGMRPPMPAGQGQPGMPPPGAMPPPSWSPPGALQGPRPGGMSGNPFGNQQLPPPTGIAPPPSQLPPMIGPPSQSHVPPPTAMPPAPPPSRPSPAIQPRMLWSGNDRAMPGQRRFDTGGPVSGPGSGISDQIPARLSDGEYIIPAHIVAALGDGSTKAGAARLDELQRQVRTGVGKQMMKNRHPKASKQPIALMGERK